MSVRLGLSIQERSMLVVDDATVVARLEKEHLM